MTLLNLPCIKEGECRNKGMLLCYHQRAFSLQCKSYKIVLKMLEILMTKRGTSCHGTQLWPFPYPHAPTQAAAFPETPVLGYLHSCSMGPSQAVLEDPSTVKSRGNKHDNKQRGQHLKSPQKSFPTKVGFMGSIQNSIIPNAITPPFLGPGYI